MIIALALIYLTGWVVVLGSVAVCGPRHADWWRDAVTAVAVAAWPALVVRLATEELVKVVRVKVVRNEPR